VEAIRSKRIGGAGIDISSYEPPLPDSPLFKLDGENVILTPNVAGGSLDDCWRAVATGLFSQLAG
jgi:phosphoglycerate dehydrogenase-like enzyme